MISYKESDKEKAGVSQTPVIGKKSTFCSPADLVQNFTDHRNLKKIRP